LRYSDIVADCRKNRGAEEITTLSTLTRSYIAWSFLFGCDICNKLAWTRSLSIRYLECSASSFLHV